MSILEYMCPKCGATMIHHTLLSYPPQHQYVCTKCEYQTQPKSEKIERKPLPEEYQ